MLTYQPKCQTGHFFRTNTDHSFINRCNFQRIPRLACLLLPPDKASTESSLFQFTSAQRSHYPIIWRLRMKTRKSIVRPEYVLASCVMTAGFTPNALAQAASGPAAEISEILITGTRRSGMAVSDSPAPVQMITNDVLVESGAPDLMNAIANQVPSYNAEQRGTDMASQTLTASMRALSPNHSLVLVNGKRRHITSNVGASSGSAATDLSFIPSSSINHMEVLTDGAAALYGSDAIAGVINIILKDDYEGGSIRTNVSEYSHGGGYTSNVQANYGFGGPDAFVNMGLEFEERETVSRSVVYGPAVCVANAE